VRERGNCQPDQAAAGRYTSTSTTALASTTLPSPSPAFLVATRSTLPSTSTQRFATSVLSMRTTLPDARLLCRGGWPSSGSGARGAAPQAEREHGERGGIDGAGCAPLPAGRERTARRWPASFRCAAASPMARLGLGVALALHHGQGGFGPRRRPDGCGGFAG
jgi:hypothetical protein